MQVERYAKMHDIPGPGTYEDTQSLHKTGLYTNSQLNNSKAAKINTGRRFFSDDNKKPGPGEYEETGKIASGAQVCSNFHSTIVKNIGTTASRTQWGGNPRFRTPAPGTYRPPSDFGYLDFNYQFEANRSILQGTVNADSPSMRALELGKLDSNFTTF